MVVPIGYTTGPSKTDQAKLVLLSKNKLPSRSHPPSIASLALDVMAQVGHNNDRSSEMADGPDATILIMLKLLLTIKELRN